MSLRQQRVIIPILLVALVLSTLLYGYHSQFGRPYGAGSQPYEAVSHPPPHGAHDTHKDPNERHKDRGRLKKPVNVSSSYPEASYWTAEEIAGIPKWSYPNHNEPIEAVKYAGESHEDRIRYEISDVWRTEQSLVDQDTGVVGLPRLKHPKRTEYESDGQYLRQPIIGDFNYGADKLFLMLKTGADTQWKRMPQHFMTDLTHAQNFALYSDAPGSIFGHELIDILRDLPKDIIEGQWELQRYRAHLQSHDEHWNWAPEQLKADGGWLVDRYKNIPMLLDSYKKNPNCDWYLWVDDDSFVFYDTMVKWLETMDPNKMIYTGAAAGISYNDESFYFAHGGSVVAVSHAIAEALFGPPEKRKHSMTDEEFLEKWAHQAVPICCGDALFALMLIKELDTIMYTHPEFGEYIWFGGAFQGEGIASLIIPKDRFCTPIATWHHLTPNEIERLYTYERLWDKDRAITYHDIYRDFYLPYVVDERPNWRLAESGTPEFYPPKDGEHDPTIEFEGKSYNPTFSKEDCKKLCQAKENCAAWTWKHEFCMLQTTGFSFGSAANKWNEHDEGYVSGWMVDRIREWRLASPCDPLTKHDGVFNDDESTSEGWMIRKLEKERPALAFEGDSSLPTTAAAA